MGRIDSPHLNSRQFLTLVVTGTLFVSCMAANVQAEPGGSHSPTLALRDGAGRPMVTVTRHRVAPRNSMRFTVEIGWSSTVPGVEVCLIARKRIFRGSGCRLIERVPSEETRTRRFKLTPTNRAKRGSTYSVLLRVDSPNALSFKKVMKLRVSK